MEAKSEIRHRKQKEKLLGKLQDTKQEERFIPKPDEKDLAFEAARRNGFNCSLGSDGIIMFNKENIENVTSWLLENFGKDENGTIRVPFSFGFIGNKEE